MKDIKTTALSDNVVRHFSEKNCIVINHAAPLSVQDDEQALEYVWRQVMCKDQHWNIHFLCTPRGNVFRINPSWLHHYFDNGHVSYQELEKALYVDEYQRIESLPETGVDNVRVINLLGVFGIA